jgi:two-component system, chemotaxis family, sensor kinase Cph1
VRAAVRAVQAVQAATCLQQLVDETVLRVRTITGFDRVMVYRFTEEWHGNVVAEARADHMHFYLHHFFRPRIYHRRPAQYFSVTGCA